jgi:hypothetical protein
MKRSYFFIANAVVALFFCLMLAFLPVQAAVGFGLQPTGEVIALFRALAGLILSVGLLSWLVRNEPDSSLLGTVLLFLAAVHALAIVADQWSVAAGHLQFSKILPGQIPHLLLFLGALYYWRKLKAN